MANPQKGLHRKMALQSLKKIDICFPELPTSENFNWSTIRSPAGECFSERPESTKTFERKIIIPSPQSRRVRIKETEVEWWLGKVTEVGEDCFTGRLEDLSGNVSIVEFENDVISMEELRLLYEGAVFTYSISAVDNPTSRSGGREYKTKLAFSGKKRWLNAYSEKARSLGASVFPEEWL